MRPFIYAILICCLPALTVHADPVEHFDGEPAPTLEAAMANLVKYNRQLQQALQGELDNADMMAIHQLTYSLENALQRLDTEVDNIEASLEKVHIASETGQPAVVREQGSQYLQQIGKITD